MQMFDPTQSDFSMAGRFRSLNSTRSHFYSLLNSKHGVVCQVKIGLLFVGKFECWTWGAAEGAKVDGSGGQPTAE